MGYQIVRSLFSRALLFLFGEHRDRATYDFGFRLASLSRQLPDQGLSLGI
jgi:hypothetical protein